jgi:hypothetical protein
MPPAAQDRRMEVVVQWVRTSWTKRSRGGQEAARRHAAPIAFPLPCLHEVVMAEQDGFQPRSTMCDLPDSSLNSGVRPACPADTGRGPPLAPGEWLRWQVNYRFSGYHGWSYRLDTYNVGYGPARADLFLGTPTHHVDELATLF